MNREPSQQMALDKDLCGEGGNAVENSPVPGPSTTSDKPLPTSDEPLPTSDEPLPTSDEPLPTSDEPLPTSDELLPTNDDIIQDYSSLEDDLYLTDTDSMPDATWKLDNERSALLTKRDISNITVGNSQKTLAGPERQSTRWRKKVPSEWGKNVNRKKMFEGLPYINSRKKLRPAKQPKAINCSRCRFKCSETFTENDRTALCSAYWGLSNYTRQKDFILKHVKEDEPKRRLANPSRERKYARRYYFVKNNEMKRVCQKYFERTLCISNGPINTAFERSNDLGLFTDIDNRGKGPSSNTPSDADVSLIKSHIESFPTIELHYCRKTCSTRYLDGNLSIQKMHELYEEHCLELGRHPLSLYVYRRIFCSDYNLTFYKPKKVLCATCYAFTDAKKNPMASIPDDLQTNYNEHFKRKSESFAAKDSHKEQSTTQPSNP